MNNSSGLHPLGHRVLVLLDPVMEQSPGGVVLSHGTIQQDKMAQIHGTIVEIGPLAGMISGPSGALGTGARVVFRRYAGEYVTGIDGVSYRIMNDDDIYSTRDFHTSEQAKEQSK